MSSKATSIDELITIPVSTKTQHVAAAIIQDFAVYKDQEIPLEMARRIRGAIAEVNLSFYKFAGDSDGGKVIMDAFTALAQKANALNPIKITMLLNKRGWVAQKFYKNNPESTGLKALQALAKQHPYFQFNMIYHEAKIFNSYHAKQVIVDPGRETGSVMFCSGDFQADNNVNHHQNETALLIEDKTLSTIAHKDFKTALYYACTPCQNKNPNTEMVIKSPKNANVLYLSSKAHGNPLTNPGTAPFKEAMITCFRQAKHTIRILTPNLNDPEIINALSQAANRGVNIKLVTGKFRNAHQEKFFGGTNLESIRTLYRLVKPECRKHLRIRWVMNPITQQVVLNGEPYSTHAKFCMVDKRFLMMGSSPLDTQAMRCSREIDAIVQLSSEQNANQVLKKLFNEPYALARDYTVDRVLSRLHATLIRLKKYDNKVAVDKRTAIEKVIKTLSVPGITPTQVEMELLGIKTVISKKRNPWHKKKPHSLKMLETCLKFCVCNKHLNDKQEGIDAIDIWSKKTANPISTSLGKSNEDSPLQSVDCSKSP